MGSPRPSLPKGADPPAEAAAAGTSRDVFIARQPIFDPGLNTVAYELLFRAGWQNWFSEVDAARADACVLESSLSEFGLDTLVGPRKAFLNMGRHTLVQHLWTMLPRERVVIEVLETVDPDPEVVAAARALRGMGYELALDDFVLRADYEPLLALATIVKVDFRQSGPDERAHLARSFLPRGIRLLAEKVETAEEQREARELGYSLFQGYFFCRPEVLARTEVPRFKLNYLRFLQEIHRPELDFDRLEQVFRHEVSLSVKLLRYLNSAAFGWRREVKTIREALVRLGERPMRKWATVVALMGLGEDRPPELVLTGLVRARFCELLGALAGLRGRELDLFLMGMLSVVDGLLGRPLREVLSEVSLAEDAKRALLGARDGLGRLFALVLAHERGDWQEDAALVAELGLAEAPLAAAYAEAVSWAGRVLKPG